MPENPSTTEQQDVEATPAALDLIAEIKRRQTKNLLVSYNKNPLGFF